MASSSQFAEIAENLSYLDDWEDRYRYIIEIGQALPPLDDADRTAENKVSGCTSQVWLTATGDKDALTFRGASDALIVNGLVAILIALYSGRPAAEIVEIDAMPIFDELGLREHLSTQRSNGLFAMVERIRHEARARL